MKILLSGVESREATEVNTLDRNAMREITEEWTIGIANKGAHPVNNDGDRKLLARAVAEHLYDFNLHQGTDQYIIEKTLTRAPLT